MGTLSLVIHVTAATILVGPQLLMLLAVVPASWLIEDDERLRRSVLRVIAGRFGMLSAAALLLLFVTGIFQYVTVSDAAREGRDGSHFAAIFGTKMLMFAILLVLIWVHTRLFAQRISALSDEVIALEDDPAQDPEVVRERVHALEDVRQKSFTFSFLILLVSLTTLWLGVALGNTSPAEPPPRNTATPTPTAWAQYQP